MQSVDCPDQTTPLHDEVRNQANAASQTSGPITESHSDPVNRWTIKRLIHSQRQRQKEQGQN